MRRILLTGLMAMSLLLLGSSCAMQQKVEPVPECQPEILVEKVLVPIPAELTLIHENPSIPSAGDNAALLDWAQACAANTRDYQDQMTRLRELSSRLGEGSQ